MRRLALSVRLPQLAKRSAEWAVVRWLLPLALLHGLLYLALVPPWEHYDEPGHFLYAAEIAAGELGGRGPSAVSISREVADSMYRHRFLGGAFRPDLLQPGSVRLGEDQGVHPPLYYASVAAILRPARFLSVEAQLYLARSLSLVLYALTVVAAWRITVAVLPNQPLAQLAIPLIVLLNPAFTDLMTALNNDVLLNFALTVALLGAVLLVRDGLSPARLVLMLLALGVAVAVKRTALAAVLPLALAVVWGARRSKLSAWVGLAGMAIGLVIVYAALEPVLAGGSSDAHWVLAPRPWLKNVDRQYLRLDLASWFRSVSDLTLAGQRYQLLAGVGFVSFWARLSWGNVALPPAWDWLFAGLVFASLLGLAVGMPRARAELPLWQRRCLWLFALTVTVACLALVARLHPLPPIDQPIYVPRGRYVFWAIVPVTCLLCLGLQWLLPLRWRSLGLWALVAFFAVTDVTAIAALANAYYRA